MWWILAVIGLGIGLPVLSFLVMKFGTYGIYRGKALGKQKEVSSTENSALRGSNHQG